MEPRVLKVKTEKEADEICRLLDDSDKATREGEGKWIAMRKLWKAAYKACPGAAEEGTQWKIGMHGPIPTLTEILPEPKAEKAPKPTPKKKAKK